MNTADFDRDGKRVVTASDDGSVRIWNALTGEPIGAPLQHEKAVKGAWFNPDGTHVLSVTANGHGFIWDVATGRTIGKTLRHIDAINDAVFSPDGSRRVGCRCRAIQ